LVETLRLDSSFIQKLSLVAEIENILVGHILFFPILIVENETEHKLLALVPMSVLPNYQKKGIGSEIVNKGLI
jgi:putative acetyltransferase